MKSAPMRDGQLVGGQGVLGPVAGGAPVRDDERPVGRGRGVAVAVRAAVGARARWTGRQGSAVARERDGGAEDEGAR